MTPCLLCLRLRVLYLLLSIALPTVPVWSALAPAATHTRDDLPVRDIGSAYEIHRIDMTGNTAIPTAVLQGVLVSRASEKSTARRIVEFYRTRLEAHPLLFSTYTARMRECEHRIGDRREYFNRGHIGQDTFRIRALYNERGFHRIAVRTTFTFDPATRENVLTFHITEYPPARLDTLVYLGIDSLPPDVAPQVRGAMTLACGGVFSQEAIAAQNRRILDILLDNGYYFAVIREPLVLYLPHRNIDSVTVFCSTGRRMRFGRITLVDSTVGQPPVTEALRRDLMEFREGDWYNRSAVVRSAGALLHLGLYRVVSIDTSSAVHPHTDSTLSFLVYTSMQNMHSVGGSILANKGPDEPFWNVGMEGFVELRNVFSRAQTFSLHTRAVVSDVNGWMERRFRQPQLEFSINPRWQQPYLWHRPGFSVDGGAEILYSYQTVYPPLKLLTRSLSGTLAWRSSPRLTTFTELTLAQEQPVNFSAAYEKALAQPGISRTLVRRLLYQYARLDTIVNMHGVDISKVILGISPVFDSRNSPFTPDRGMYASGAVEVGFGGTQFVRLAATCLEFTSPAPNHVLAFKLRAGHIFWLDKADSYIPLDRHFFAGGSNSVRAFASRELRAEPIDTAAQEDLRGFADVIGSGSLFEGSVEYRLHSLYLPRSDALIEQILGRLGAAVFVDFGNAYNSFLENPSRYAAKKVSTFIQKIALGVGAGLRIATPVGPVRFDLAAPLYNPMIARAEPPLRHMRWHVGIGHAF